MTLRPAYGNFFSGESNPSPYETVYVKGNANTDASIRLVVDEFDTTKAEIQYRTSGVWNTTGLTISGNTLNVGRELAISAFGEFIQSYDAGDLSYQLHPHIHYDSTSGTVETGYFPDFGALNEQFVVQSDDTSQLNSTDGVITATNTATLNTIVTKVYYKIGATPATANIKYMVSRQISGDQVQPFFSQTFPASTFAQAEGTIIELELDSPNQGTPGETLITEIESEDGSAFSLLGNSSGEPWIAFDLYLTDTDPIMTQKTISHVLVDVTSEIIVDENGDVVMTEAVIS